MTTLPKDSTSPKPTSRWRQLAWMVGIWGASVLALAVFAYVLKLIMSAVGLHT